MVDLCYPGEEKSPDTPVFLALFMPVGIPVRLAYVGCCTLEFDCVNILMPGFFSAFGFAPNPEEAVTAVRLTAPLL